MPAYDEVRLTRLPYRTGTAHEQEDWETFVRHSLNLLWIRVRCTAAPAYRDFLAAKYGRIDDLNRHYRTDLRLVRLRSR